VYCVVFVSEFVGEFVFVQACGCTAVQDNATPQSKYTKYTIFSCTDRVSCDGEKERRKEKPREVGGESAGEGGREGGGKRESERERKRKRERERERERERQREREREREREETCNSRMRTAITRLSKMKLDMQRKMVKMP
jgi:hypothetical protein